MTLFYLVLFSSVSAAIYVLYRRSLPKPIAGIPYNVESTKRLTGDVPHLLTIREQGRRIRAFWEDLAQRHNSPLIQFFMPFSKPGVVVWDFREAKDLLVRRAKYLDRGPMNNDMWWGALPHHFIGMDTRDPRFSESKLMQKDLMTHGFLHRVSAPASYDTVLQLIELWEVKAERARGRSFDAIDDLNHFTADVIFAAALGIEDNKSNTKQNLDVLHTTEDSVENAQFDDVVFQFPKNSPHGLLKSILVLGAAIGQAPTSPSQKLYWYITNLRPKIREANEVKKKILQEHIDLALARIRNQGDEEPRLHAAVDYMVSRELTAAQESGRTPRINSPMFHDLLFGYCLGGQDTTHTVLSFLVKQLSNHQKTQSKLRKCLREAHGTALTQRRSPTQEEITKTQIPLLDAVLYEVMRCDTPSPFITKQTLTDLVILGTVVPKGTQLFFPLFGASLDAPAHVIDESLRSETSSQHATPSDWANARFPPDEFHAERWLRDDPEDEDRRVFDPLAGPFMSFGAGVRECWGKRLALLQLRLVATLLVWNFEFLELPDKLNSSEVVDVLNAKPKECFVRLRKIHV